MLGYISRRILQLIPLLIILSALIFIVIQLPAGDYVTMQINQLELQGTQVSASEISRLKELYNLDKPAYMQYLMWIEGLVLRGDLGRSMETGRPVSEVLGDRILLTVLLSLLTLTFTWVVAIPAGIYSATHQYSAMDHFLTLIGFLGVSVPGFLLALVVIYVVFTATGQAVTGLFSPQFVDMPWNLAKVADLLKHIWLPMVVIGISGTAGLIRVMRGMMLDELQKQYVITARAKGVAENTLLFKYPVRLAMNPIISTVGWLLPAIFSGEALVATVLNLPTIGPLMLRAVLVQDMPVAGSCLLLSSLLAVVGTLLSDIVLAWFDPRIRFGGVQEET
jgi:peptide/nickel transport system permease protein